MKELKHILGFVKHNVTYNWTFVTYGNDVWEDVNIFVYSDSNFACPRRDGLRLIVMAGRNGSTFPVEWRSKGQATTTTRSGDTGGLRH